MDDGKSTLIGRLLYDSKMIFEDQLAALAADSKKVGTRGGDLDFALLVDGLSAEREQGITIDVAYRFFSTDKRKFIVADTPGHEQYTRNMVTGASTADLAVILIDARKGVLTQTRRHSYHRVAAGHPPRGRRRSTRWTSSTTRADVFDRIERDYREFAARIGLTDVTCIPVSAIHGHNIAARAPEMPWYEGPTLFEHLETVEVGDVEASRPFRLPVQWANRPDSTISWIRGADRERQRFDVGDPVRVLPSGSESRVARILVGDRDVDAAVAGQSVTVTLADDVDVSRGDVLAARDAPPAVADQFEATIVWMDEHPLLQGRTYLMKIGADHGVGDGRPDQIQGQRQHAGARRGEEAGVERYRRVRPRARAARWCSSRTARTGNSAASSSSIR